MPHCGTDSVGGLMERSGEPDKRYLTKITYKTI